MFPINKGISDYRAKKRISFSMPGHKGNGSFDGNDIFKNDVTELDDTDNLLSPVSYIAESQKKLSEIYGTVSTHYMLNGSTGGIYAMIFLAAGEGDKIIVDRFCHKSVISAIILCGAEPVYAVPEYNYRLGISGGMKPETIENAVKACPDAKAVIITSPSYYGTVSDISAISRIVHNSDMMLLVDEAHGAHFHISEELPKSAVSLGADLAVQSVHKTLGALSGGALLHICTEKIPKWRIEEVLSLVQTSSPSYGVLSVLENAVYESFNFEKKYKAVISQIGKSREEVNKLGKAYWCGSDLCGSCGIFDIDKTRIVINFSRLQISGYAVSKILREKHKIEAEMADENNIVLIATPFNTVSHIKVLERAIVSITKGIPAAVNKKGLFGMPDFTIRISPRKAYMSPWETIDMSEAEGRIARRVVCKYPPGIPVLVSGEEITAAHIKYITDAVEAGAAVSGIEDDYKITVCKY